MLVDVSHVVEHGMVTYKGLPAPLVCDFLSREQSRSHYAPGTEFHIGKIEMVANTGTYLDSPFHRYANGKDLSELPLERLANLEGVVISADLSKGRGISRAAFKDHDLRGKAVLVRTDWDAHWRTDQYFEGHPATNLLDIARALSLSLDYLMTGDASVKTVTEVSIPAALARFAADEGISLRQTLMLLDMQKQIVAHRSAKKKDDLESVDWRKFYEGVKEFLENE